MEIKEYNKSGLIKLLNDSNFWHQKHIPITKAKISHQIKNPNLSESDILLFTIEDCGSIISYLGAIPDNIDIKNEIKKIFWLSTWWIDPEYSKTTNAAILFFHAWKKFSGNIAISSFSTSAGNFYKILNKFSIIEKKRYLLFFNFDNELFIQKFPKLKIFSSFLKVIIVLISIKNRISYYFMNKRIVKKNIKIEYVNSIDQETWTFIRKLAENDLVTKSQAYFNWKLNDSSNIITPLINHIENDYEFSSFFEKRHIKIAYKIFLNTQIIGFNFFTINNNTANLQFNYVASDFIDIASDFLVLHVLKLNCTSLFCEDEDMFRSIKRKRSLVFKSFNFQKDAIIAKKIINDNLQNVKTKLHYGDGG